MKGGLFKADHVDLEDFLNLKMFPNNIYCKANEVNRKHEIFIIHKS